MRLIEKRITEELRRQVERSLDHYRFAYKSNRGTNDAISTLMHLVLKHLESSLAYRLLFIDFSSAFNTIHPHTLLEKLVNLKVNPSLIHCYYSFLTNRTQQIKSLDQC